MTYGVLIQVSRLHTRAVVFASTMAKLDSETLVKYAAQTEKALTDKTLSAISNLSPDVVLHQDAFTLQQDIKGEAEVKKYLQTYFDKYEYEHDTLGYGVNPDSSCSFALSYDKVRTSHPQHLLQAHSSTFCYTLCYQVCQAQITVWHCCCNFCVSIVTDTFSCVKLQGVHLKNKGSLPEEAVKPVPTVGKPFQLALVTFVVLHLGLYGWCTYTVHNIKNAAAFHTGDAVLRPAELAV